MNSPEVKEFIRENSALFWYIPENKKEDISLELVVETILNYGNMDSMKQLIKILGTKQVATIFFNATERKQLNYYPEIHNFFSLLFRKYA